MGQIHGTVFNPMHLSLSSDNSSFAMATVMASVSVDRELTTPELVIVGVLYTVRFLRFLGFEGMPSMKSSSR
jgi:hypothetical protein